MKKTNAERFMDSFISIEQFLKIESGKHEYIPFARQVIELSKKNVILERYKDDLLQLAELRNAIVHHRADNIHVIAEPHDSTVEQLLFIYKKLTSPPLVYPRFKKNVKVFYESTKLSEVLQAISKMKYSQFPIYSDTEQFVGVITAKAITKWLAEHISYDMISIQDTYISEVIHYQQEKPYEWIAMDSTVYEAEEIFKKSAVGGKELNAILITNTGKESEELVGLITVWDMVEIE